MGWLGGEGLWAGSRGLKGEGCGFCEEAAPILTELSSQTMQQQSLPSHLDYL